MKNKISYIKKLIKTLIWPIMFMIGSFIIRYIFVAIYNLKEKNGMSDNQFLKYIKTIEYQEKLNNYINSKVILISLIILIIFLPIFYKKYKKYIIKNKLKIQNTYIPIIFGISISLIYNILAFNINNIVNFTNNYVGNNMPIISQIISSVLVGPILEEVLFRGIIYNKLKEFNSPMKSIILTSIIFGIFHFNLLNMIFAFGMSFIFIYLYEKNKSLKYPIIMHVFLNLTSIVFVEYISKFNIYLSGLIFIVNITILLLLKKYVINK